MIHETSTNPLATAEVVTMPKEEALHKFNQYREAVKRSHSAADHVLALAYGALAKGEGVINAFEAIKQAGCDDSFRPRLAIMRADQEFVYFKRSFTDASAGIFSFSERYYLSRRVKRAQNARLQFAVPGSTFRKHEVGKTSQPRDYWWTLKAPLPLIPPQYRPADALAKYAILWEVDEWSAIAPPTDPMLLRPLGQTGLYVVVAHWDLTPLERMVMGGLLRLQNPSGFVVARRSPDGKLAPYDSSRPFEFWNACGVWCRCLDSATLYRKKQAAEMVLSAMQIELREQSIGCVPALPTLVAASYTS
jgi:hypothetical protein